MTAPSGSVPEPAEGEAKRCVCGHDWRRHGPEAPGCIECRCRALSPTRYATPPVPAPTEPKENTVSERGCEGCGLTGSPWEVTGVRQDSPEDDPTTIDSWACDDDLADVVRLIQDRIGYSTVVVIEHV